MTKPDLTSTAPKRIYLDIGDQFALEAVASGAQRWDLLEGVTWSEDNATSHGIPYVRADLVPNLAASGAAPLTDEQIDDWITTIATYDIVGPRMHGKEQIRRFARAIAATALASPQVAPALTLEVLREILVKHDRSLPVACVEEILAAAVSPISLKPATDEGKALRAVHAFAKGAMRTNSSYLEDWRNDMQEIVSRAARGLESPEGGAT